MKVSGVQSERARSRAKLGMPRATRHGPRPFVLLNLAMTADGKIATANRAVSSFGSNRDHANLLALRATADAVMCGARTADLNDINLGPGPATFRRRRLKHGLAEYNLRIIVSGSGSISPRAEVFKFNPLTRPTDTLSPSDGERDGVRGRDCLRQTARAASPIIILTTKRMSTASRRRLEALGASIKVGGKSVINFRTALRWLRQRWNVKRLLCEGGGELNDALLRAGLVDELHLTICAKVFGGRNAPTIADGEGFQKLAGATHFKLTSARHLGEEMFLVYASSPRQTPSLARGSVCGRGRSPTG